MRTVIALLTLAFVAACGANDPPIRPTGNVGISVGPNGVTPNVGIGATNGNLNFGLSL